MTLEGYLTVIAIIISLVALAHPIQKKSVIIFSNIYFIVLCFSLSFAFLIMKEVATTMQFQINPSGSLLINLGAFLLPLAAISYSIILWYNARIKKVHCDGLIELIKSCINENRYDELIRILRRNMNSDSISSDVTYFLFSDNVIKHINTYPDWIGMNLLLNKHIANNLKNRYESIDHIIRDLMIKENSILKKDVLEYFGGQEHISISKEERLIIDKTFLCPDFYFEYNIHYPVLLFACEKIKSGLLDIDYNNVQELYTANQGWTTKIYCPIYIFIYLHYRVILQLIKRKQYEKDAYLSDFFDVFKNICDHLILNENVWNANYYIDYAPTPYSYLLQRILYIFKNLLEESLRTNDGLADEFSKDIIRKWLLCVWYLVHSEKVITDRFRISTICMIMEYILSIYDNHQYLFNFFKKEIKKYSLQNKIFENAYQVALSRLDIGKSYIQKYRHFL